MVIVVTPHLLGDTLSKVLAGKGRDILVLTAEPTIDSGTFANEERHFHVALLSDPVTLPDAFHADVVVRLPDAPGGGTVRIADDPVAVDSVEGLVALVEGCLPDVGSADGCVI